MHKSLFSVFLLLMCMLSKSQTKPNVIFILGDDVGYEIPAINGSNTYSTPNIDSMARHGMNFTHCESSPLCSPSRFMLLTGKYNFRNYSIWGYMNNGEKTVGNLMKDAGYKTGWFGKSQLFSRDSDMINMGFDEYLVFDALNYPAGYRYKNATLYTNGDVKIATGNAFSEDVFTQRLFDFIDSNKNKPFFAYYPMTLCHEPFTPTPDDSAFVSWDPATQPSDTSYFPSMVKYMDKKIGQILKKLRREGLDQNTIVIFAGDNGTPQPISSIFEDSIFFGGKSTTTERGTHVPMMLYWPGHIVENSFNNDLIDFTDFFPTFADIAGVTNLTTYGIKDGRSFYPRVTGQAGNPRDWVFDYYDPYPNFKGKPKRWIQNKTYKLYSARNLSKPGNFFNIAKDVSELKPLADSVLTDNEKALRQYFTSVLDTMAIPPGQPVLADNFVTNITDTSAVMGATVFSDGGAQLKERGSLVQQAPQLAYYHFTRLVDSVALLGPFQQTRTGLKPQTLFNYSLYAMNANQSDNTGFIIGDTFRTSSARPLKQPGFFNVNAGGCAIMLKWGGAVFPSYLRATKAGYLLLYSTGVPALVANPNRKPPGTIIKHGTILPIASAFLPNLPATSDTLLHLSHDSTYNFLLIPYTWDGFNDNTYNYLVEGALKGTATPLISGISINTTIEKPSCVGSTNGLITVSASNGFAPFLYSFNKSSFDTVTTFTNIAAGTYSVTVTDVAGCSSKKSIVVTDPVPISFTSVHTDAQCSGTSSGSVTLIATGGNVPYKYSFNGNSYDTAHVFKDVAAGLYNAYVKDNKGCFDSLQVVVKQPAVLAIKNTHTNALCNGIANGTITGDADGGTAPYKFNLNNGSYGTNTFFGNLGAGTYNLNVSDKNGCVASELVTITQPPPIIIIPSAIWNNNGTITIKATGGKSPYKYSFNGSAFTTTAIYTGLSAGLYSVNVIDSSGCPASSSVTVIQPGHLTVNFWPNPSHSQFRLDVISEDISNKVDIRVVDVLGNSVYITSGQANSSYYLGGSFETGIYFARITQGSNSKIIKLVKTR